MKSEAHEAQGGEFQPFIDHFESKVVKEVRKAVTAIGKKVTDAKSAQVVVSTPLIMNFFKQRLLTKDVKVNVAICKTLLKICEYEVTRGQLIELGFLQQLILMLNSAEKDERKVARDVLVSLSRDHERAPKILQMLTSRHSSLRRYAKRALHSVQILYTKHLPAALADTIQEELDLIETTIRAHEDSIESTRSNSVEEVLHDKDVEKEKELERDKDIDKEKQVKDEPKTPPKTSPRHHDKAEKHDKHDKHDKKEKRKSEKEKEKQHESQMKQNKHDLKIENDLLSAAADDSLVLHGKKSKKMSLLHHADKKQTLYNDLSTSTKITKKQMKKIEKILNKSHSFDEETFLKNLQIGRLSLQDVLHMAETDFLSYLPLMCLFIRKQTNLLNDKDSHLPLMKNYYAMRWSKLLEIFFFRVYSNPNIGQRLAWMENSGHGIATPENTNDEYIIRVAYYSFAFEDTNKMFHFLAENHQVLSSGYAITNLNVLVPTQLSKTATVHTVQCAKVFKSKARPVLLEWTYHPVWNMPNVKMIFKKGEDLARDMYAESLFSIFNVLWQNSPLDKIYRPYVEKYIVLPVSKFGKHNLSVIEFIENTSCQVYEWSRLRNMTKEERLKFNCSTAGAFLMGHTLSLRDRHKDNMLVKSNPERYLMIDFEWIMNNDIDLAPPLAIPGEFQEILIELNEWDLFLDIMVSGFLVLRNHYSLLSYFAHECFAPLLGRYETPWVQKLVADRLMIAHTEDRAASYFRKMVGRASKNIILFGKNKAHDLGQILLHPKPQELTEQQKTQRDLSLKKYDIVVSQYSKKLPPSEILNSFYDSDDDDFRVVKPTKTKKEHSKKTEATNVSTTTAATSHIKDKKTGSQSTDSLLRRKSDSAHRHRHHHHHNHHHHHKHQQPHQHAATHQPAQTEPPTNASSATTPTTLTPTSASLRGVELTVNAKEIIFERAVDPVTEHSVVRSPREIEVVKEIIFERAVDPVEPVTSRSPRESRVVTIAIEEKKEI